MGFFLKNGSHDETFSPRNSNSPIACTAACHRGGYRHPTGTDLRQEHFYSFLPLLAFLQGDMWRKKIEDDRRCFLTLTVPMTVATATPPRPTNADPEYFGQIRVISIFGAQENIKLANNLEHPGLRPAPPLHPLPLPRPGPEPTPVKAKTAPGGRGKASFSRSIVFSEFYIYT